MAPDEATRTTSALAQHAAPAASFDTPADVEAAVKRFRADYAKVREQIAKVIVGHQDVVDGVLVCLFCDGHALLEGVPGLGKTLLVRTLAQALQLDFSRIQFTPDLMPADITGTTIVVEHEGHREFRYRKGPIFAQIVLADEINRATPKTQSALLEAMQERSVSVEGTTHALPAPFFVMATQNPVEQEGTYPLPEAQLDRFFFKLLVGYSSRDELAAILDRTTSGQAPAAAPVLDADAIRAHQALVRSVAIAPHVRDYAVRMTLATQPGSEAATPMAERFVRFGASPRAAQALALAGKCRALLAGRPAVATDDIKWAAAKALRHRILLNFEGESEGVTPDAIVENIVATLPVQSSS